ncbi:MAG: 50S ribosomal protein L24 [Phycisphaerales bacterium]
MPAHVRKGDNVVITAGQFRGQTGTVLSVDPTSQRVVVKGPGIGGIVRTVKPTRINPKGGQVEVDRSFHISNVSPSVDGKPSRVRFEVKPDGSKVRLAVRGGGQLSVVRSTDRAKKTGGKKPAKAGAAAGAAVKKTTRKKAAASV